MIKIPIQYNADDCSLRDADFKFLGRLGGERNLTISETDLLGYDIAEAFNAHVDIRAGLNFFGTESDNTAMESEQPTGEGD